MGVEAPASP